jgi:hypothetical protein
MPRGGPRSGSGSSTMEGADRTDRRRRSTHRADRGALEKRTNHGVDYASPAHSRKPSRCQEGRSGGFHSVGRQETMICSPQGVPYRRMEYVVQRPFLTQSLTHTLFIKNSLFYTICYCTQRLVQNQVAARLCWFESGQDTRQFSSILWIVPTVDARRPAQNLRIP